MKSFLIFLIIFFNIFQYYCEQSSCRTNCSNNGTIDEKCWQDALVYRSEELIERIFSFSSLSVYIDTYQRNHRNEFNDSISFINKSLENHLLNESIDAHLNISLFREAIDLLLKFCRNLTSTPIESVDKFPSLSCATSTCSSDILNYMVLFIISIIISSLILMICIIKLIETRRKSLKSILTVQQGGQLIHSLSTTNTSVNT